eukprot:INCI3054.1.p1 GENE.INCI3054.1~~INCI3054.1.p1  ORF type:complete len:337 (-),score=44.95 INCI3054.1:866-1798(-)
MTLLSWLRIDCHGEPEAVLQTVEDVAVGNFVLNADVAARRQPWRVSLTSYHVTVQSHTAEVKLGEMPRLAPTTVKRKRLFTVLHRGELHVLFDGTTVAGGPRLAAFLARHGIENKHGEQDGSGGARRKNLNQFDNQQTKRTAQRKLAELDFTAAIRGYQYDCGDYILRVGGVFIKGNNSHSLILEVEYLPPISTSAHYTSAAEAIARELAAAAFGVGAASTRRNTGSQDHQRRMDSKDGSVGGGQASVDTHFIDVELRGSWSPPTGSSTPQVLRRSMAVAGYAEAVERSTRITSHKPVNGGQLKRARLEP